MGILVGAKWFLFHFPNNELFSIQHPFHVLVSHSCVFSGEMSTQVFCSLLSWVFVVMTEFKYSLCILQASLSLDV